MCITGLLCRFEVAWFQPLAWRRDSRLANKLVVDGSAGHSAVFVPLPFAGGRYFDNFIRPVDILMIVFYQAMISFEKVVL